MLLLTVVMVAVFASLGAFYFSEPIPDLNTAGLVIADTVPKDSPVGKAGLKGFVEVIHTDKEGNVKNYFKTPNKVVTHGEICAAKMLFGVSGGDETGTTACIGAINAGFRYIGLGEGTTAAADADTDLENPADESGLSTPLLSTAVWTNSTTGSFNTIVLSATFTNSGSSETISEVALLNATDNTTRGMYARNVFSGIALATSDDLTINWTQELGEATVP